MLTGVRLKLSWYCWGRSAPKPPDTVKGLLPLYDSPLRPQGPRVQFCFVYTPLARQRLAALRVHKTKLCLRLSGKAGFELERLTKGGKSIMHLKKRTQNPREAQKSVIFRQLKTKPCRRLLRRLESRTHARLHRSLIHTFTKSEICAKI